MFYIVWVRENFIRVDLGETPSFTTGAWVESTEWKLERNVDKPIEEKSNELFS